MKRNLFCMMFLCLLSLMMSCGDEENDLNDSPANIVKEPIGNQKQKVADPKAEDVEQPKPEAVDPGVEAVEEPEVDDVLALRDAIDEVLKRLREGYEREDIELYMSAFWEDGFRYVSDLGTDVDRRDDVVFDNLRLERDAAKGTFARFQDIRLELSQPTHIMDIRENRLSNRTKLFQYSD